VGVGRTISGGRLDIETRIHPIRPVTWDLSPAPNLIDGATDKLERGFVLFLSDLAFPIEAEEMGVFSPAILSSSKNASYEPASGRVAGTTLSGRELERLRKLMQRFSQAASLVAHRLFPAYESRLRLARASFRPAEIAGRPSSWRKDDTRLHVDSFPSSPVQGERILRLFTNVNPVGRPRSWRVGGEFEAVARHFLTRLSTPVPGTAAILQALRVTKSRRTPYDAMMLQLHDCMKRDDEFQERSEQEAVEFPAGSTWVAFTDQVSHAATAGQYQLEQTFLLPVSAMAEQARSPLRILERLTGRTLA
jgi:hypothetical protein